MLSHICQRWRRIVYECSFHLGMHIKFTNGSPIVDMLDHFPPVPLFLEYYGPNSLRGDLTEQDELGIYHALQLHNRVYHIDLKLPPSIVHKVFVLLDGQFPKLEHLSLSFSESHLPLIFPRAFLAPNLRYLALPGISPPRRLRVLTSTASLVKLVLSNIQASSYFRPRLLVARLSSLPQLEELSIEFSTPIPRPSTERVLLGEKGTTVTLPSLKTLRFTGVGAYLESLVAQIRAPLLEWLVVTLFNQIVFVLPHLSYLVNNTEAFKLPTATLAFYPDEIKVTTCPSTIKPSPFSFRVTCTQLDWQIDCAAQICHALIPVLSSVETLRLFHFTQKIPIEMIDSATWHDLLRSFTGVKELCIAYPLLERLSHALQVDEIGSDPGFLPNLRYIDPKNNLFTSFLDARQAMGRPVQFVTG